MSVTYLQLPPEMGGTQYGPFNGIVNLGSDPARNQIVLSQAHGIFPSHAVLSPAGPGMYTVGPTAANCGLFLIQAGNYQVWPVKGAVQAKVGDTIVLGTPQGPRFTITDKKLGAAGIASQGNPGGGFSAMGVLDALFAPPKGKGVSGELARQGRARMLANNPIYRTTYQLYTRAKTGNLFNPVYVVGALTTAVTLMAGGTASCSGIAYAVWTKLMH